MDTTYLLQGVTFEWDAEKARGNVEKHGITFEEAAEAFFDPFSLSGDASVQGEDRVFSATLSRNACSWWCIRTA